MSAAMQNEMERLRAERDEYRNHLAVISEMTGNGSDIGAAHEGVNAIIEQRDAALEREQALAADRADLINELIPLQNMTHGLARSGGCSPDYPNDAKAVLERVTGGHAPFFDDNGPSANSLARRDALMQAEALEKFASSMPMMSSMRAKEALRIRAQELRKQAEGQQ